MKHYVYKITFPGMPWFYYGVHTDNGKPYFGSPKTHKWRWDFYEHEISILEWFETREQADAVEKRIINYFLNDPNCLNECAGGKFSLESLRRGAKARNQLPVKESTKQKIGRKSTESWKRLSENEKSRRLSGMWVGTPPEKRNEIAKKIQASRGTPVEILNTLTGERKNFPSLQEARKHYNIGMSTICKMASGLLPEYKGLKIFHAGIV